MLWGKNGNILGIYFNSTYISIFYITEFKIYEGDVDTSKYNCFSRLFHLVHVLQCGRGILKINWYERFQGKNIK